MNRVKHIALAAFVVLALSFCVLPVTTSHAEPNTPSTELAPSNIPGTGEGNPLVTCGNGVGNGRGATDECTFNDFIQLIQNIFNLVFALAGFVTAGLFMYAGFLMITAAGNPAQITQAKAVFRRVIIGFLILFMSFILIQQTLKYLDLSETGRQVINRIIEVPAGR